MRCFAELREVDDAEEDLILFAQRPTRIAVLEREIVDLGRAEEAQRSQEVSRPIGRRRRRRRQCSA